MTAKQLLQANGDFGQDSPILETLHRFHELAERRQSPYCVVGGLAVVRSGATRTTGDIDVLIDPLDWQKLDDGATPFKFHHDHATDMQNGITVDALFPGNEWEMVISLPKPESISEYDEDLGAVFASFSALLEIKTAVYLQKRRDDGVELAAKDLADVVSLVQVHGKKRIDECSTTMHPAVGKELRLIAAQVTKGSRRSRLTSRTEDCR